MNISNSTPGNEFSGQTSTQDVRIHNILIMLRWCILVPLSCLGCVLNISIVVVLSNRNKITLAYNYKFLLINLAVADIGTLSLSCLLNAVVAPSRNWVIGKFACVALVPLGDIFIPVSSLLVLLLGIARFRVIVNPLCKPVPKRYLFSSVLLVWTLSILVNVVPWQIWVQFNPVPHSTKMRCWLVRNPLESKVWVGISVIMFFFVPVACFWLIYGKIQAKLTRPFASFVSRLHRVSPRRKHNTQATRLIFVAGIVYTLSVSPFCLLTLVAHFAFKELPTEAKVLHELFQIMLFLNSVINPVVYCFVNYHIRKEMLVTLKAPFHSMAYVLRKLKCILTDGAEDNSKMEDGAASCPMNDIRSQALEETVSVYPQSEF